MPRRQSAFANARSSISHERKADLKIDRTLRSITCLYGPTGETVSDTTVRGKWQKWITHTNKTIKNLRRIDQELRDDKPRTRWSWVDSIWMTYLFGFLIILNALCIGLDLELSDRDGRSPLAMLVVESIFHVCFWIELFLRLFAHGLGKFCRDPWGPFDFGVTLLGSLDAWVLTVAVGGANLSGLGVVRTVRLLRLIRLLRVFRHFRPLADLVVKILGSLRALGWVTLSLFVLLYISVVIYLIMIFPECTKHESQSLECRMGWAYFYHVMLVTMEGYLDVLVKPTVALNTAWYLYWIFVVMVLNLFMVNLILGIIVQRAMAERDEEEEEAAYFVHEAEAFRKALLTLFDMNDVNHDGVLDTRELGKLLQSEKMLEIMAVFGINTDVPLDMLMKLLGFQHEKLVSFKRFYHSCVRVCATSHDIRYFMLQFEVELMNRDVSDHMSGVMRNLASLADSKGLPSESRGEGLGAFAAAATGMPASKSPPRAKSQSKATAAAPGSNPAYMCSAGFSSGFSEAFATKALLAKKRLSALQRRQEEILHTLGEIRTILFGSSGAVCCPKGHPLLPLGTSIYPIGNAEYQYWSCDCAGGPGKCRNDPVVGSHLTQLRRYHCASCRYDMCEACYQHRLWANKPFPQLRESALENLSWLPPPPVDSFKRRNIEFEYTLGSRLQKAGPAVHH